MKQFYLLLLILLSVVGATASLAQTHWNWANPRPQGNDLFGITIKSESLAIMVGAKGTVVRRVNGSWQNPIFLTSQTLRAVSHWSSVVWTVGDSGTIFQSTNDGATWANQASGHPTINLQAVLALSATHVVACGDSCYVLESTNGGSSWSHIYQNYTGAIHRIDRDSTVDGDTLLYVGDHGEILQASTTNLASMGNAGYNTTTEFFDAAAIGATIYAVGVNGAVGHSGYPNFIYFSDSNFTANDTFFNLYTSSQILLAIGTNGKIIRSTNGGISWLRVASGVTGDLFCLDTIAGAAGKLIAVGADGIVIGSTNFGQSWTRLDSGSRRPVYALAKSPNGFYFGGSDQGRMYSSNNSGMSWQMDSISLGSYKLKDIAFQPHGFGLAATGSSVVLITQDSGRSWGSHSLANMILGVACTFDSIGLAVGASGVLYRSIDRGLHWDSISMAGAQLLRDVDCYGSNAIAVGDNGAVLCSSDAGANWYPSLTSIAVRTNRVRFATSATAIMVGVYGDVWRTTNAGSTWSSCNSPVRDTLCDIAWHDDINGIIVGYGGAILRTTNAGTNWTLDNPPTKMNLYATIITSGTSAFVAGDSGVILSTTNSLLPVELVSFSGSRVGQNIVRLDWSVTQQSNNAGFRVERLNDTLHNESWNALGSVPVDVAYAGDENFSFVDINASNSQCRYRLIQLDLDGAEHTLGELNIAAVKTSTAQISLWPNPASNYTHISYALSAQGDMRCTVYDELGRIVLRKDDLNGSSGPHVLALNTSHLSAGLYRVQISSGNTTTTLALSLIR
jgi:photosystem II stability/assembly factor-like uncharacterized protein